VAAGARWMCTYQNLTFSDSHKHREFQYTGSVKQQANAYPMKLASLRRDVFSTNTHGDSGSESAMSGT
jgi:hypothetical protein